MTPSRTPIPAARWAAAEVRRASSNSSFRIGGPADHFLRGRVRRELESPLLGLAREQSLSYVIGSGTNMLFDDDGFRGLIVKNEARGLSRRGEEVTALAGTPLGRPGRFLTAKAWSGLEFLAGIPGTVGGAVCGNAGRLRPSIGEGVGDVGFSSPTGEQPSGRAKWHLPTGIPPSKKSLDRSRGPVPSPRRTTRAGSGDGSKIT